MFETMVQKTRLVGPTSSIAGIKIEKKEQAIKYQLFPAKKALMQK
jgi:hypothetical protein